eukprot:m.295371 g.295371  ORF g.295371 m.295371 type:complete len:53 (-) comp20037_c0_seq28:2670-2828(-)
MYLFHPRAPEPAPAVFSDILPTYYSSFNSPLDRKPVSTRICRLFPDKRAGDN